MISGLPLKQLKDIPPSTELPANFAQIHPPRFECGEMVRWTSVDEGKTWRKSLSLTSGSVSNQTYARRPLRAADGFYAFWADGNPDSRSVSHLYFCDKEGKVYRMPYSMTKEWEKPEPVY